MWRPSPFRILTQPLRVLSAQFNKLGNLSRQGLVQESTIDTAVSRLFGARFRLGEFDAPGAVPFQNATVYNETKLTPPLLRLAREAAKQSLVLLKNSAANNTVATLPLSFRAAAAAVAPSSSGEGKRAGGRVGEAVGPAPLPSIAVVGIESYMNAGYDTGGGADVLTSDALRATGKATVRAAVGCEDGPACTVYNASSVAAAVQGTDTVLVFVGTGGMEGEMHDLGDLQLKGSQPALVQDAIANAPGAATIVVVLLTCAPLNITWIVDSPRVGAVVQAFYPQQSGGTAIAEALLGQCGSGVCWGRLPYTWPRDLTYAGDINNYTMLGTRKTFRYAEPDPLFPFGFGLGYAGPFASSNLRVGASSTSAAPAAPATPAASVKVCDGVVLTATVRNAGTVDGAHVVQVYLRWLGCV